MKLTRSFLVDCFILALIWAVTPALATSNRNKRPALKLVVAQYKPGSTLTNDQLFNGFGCSGMNRSPELSWVNAPADTQSFAVTLYDPDSPTGSGWWHWGVFNIAPTVSKLEAGAGSTAPDKLPEGAAQSRSDFGQPGYGGACPPVGDKPHRYIFTVYALKVPRIDLMSDASGAMLGFYLHQYTLKKASITLKYGRKR